MRKMGKQGNLLFVGLVLVIVVLVAGGIFMFTENSVVPGQDVTNIESCADSTGVLTLSAVNALQKGTAVTSPTITAGVDGNSVATSVTSGTTTFPVGKEVTVLVSKADYLDKSLTFVMPCGGASEEVEMYYSTSDNPGIRVKNDDGDFVTDSISGGAVNQTDLSAGEVLKMDVEISGTSLESSGDGILVVELPASSSANVTNIELTGAEKVSLPQVHNTVNAGSKVQAFRVPAVVGPEKATHTLSIELGTNKDLSGGVYMDWYAEQEFVDDNGQIATGVEDSTGDAQYENTEDFDFLINNA